MSERPHLGLVDPPADGSPDLAELQQHEALPEFPIPAVPVHVDGPVQVQTLPPRTSVVRTIMVDNITPQEVLSADLRRSLSVLYAHDSGIVVGLTQTDCQIPVGSRANGAYWPMGLQLSIRGSSRLFVASSSATPTRVSVISESWAD